MHKRQEAQGRYQFNFDHGKSDPQFVNTLARGLDILSAFRIGDKELGSQEISRRTKLPKSTVSRLLYTLVCLNYLTYNDLTGKYSTGFRAVQLGYNALGIWGVTDHIRPMMKELANETGGTTSLGMNDKTRMHYVQVCSPDNVLHATYDHGQSLPIPFTSMGRAYYISLPENEKRDLKAWLASEYAERWSNALSGLEDAENFYKENGFVMSVGQWAPGLHSVGVPICLPQNKTRLALSLGGPGFILPEKKLREEVGPKLKKLARSIECKMAAT